MPVLRQCLSVGSVALAHISPWRWTDLQVLDLQNQRVAQGSHIVQSWGRWSVCVWQVDWA